MSRRPGGTDNQGNSGSERRSRLSSQWDCLSEEVDLNEGAAEEAASFFAPRQGWRLIQDKMQLAAG